MANLSSALYAILSVTLVLGIMIFVHEWGHFMAAKLAGVRVDVFSFGFGPRLFGVKRGDTDYRLSALPFGGYVRMAGDNPIEERTGARLRIFVQAPLGARADRLRRPGHESAPRFFDFLGNFLDRRQPVG